MISLITFPFLFFCLDDLRILHFSLHDALPISSFAARTRKNLAPARHSSLFLSAACFRWRRVAQLSIFARIVGFPLVSSDRKSTRLNSSHQIISYAVFCLKKKKNTTYM